MPPVSRVTAAGAVDAPDTRSALAGAESEPPRPQTTAAEAVAGLTTLFRQYSQYFAGLFGSLLLGFLSFPVFTRIFSVSDYGVLDFIQKIVTLMIAVGKLGFQHAVVRFYDHDKFAQEPKLAQRYFSTMFFGGFATALTVTIGFVAIVAVLPGTVIEHLLPGAVVEQPLRGLLCFASGLILLGGIESLQWGFLRVQERSGTYSAAMICIKGGTLAVIYLLLWLGQRGVYVFFAGSIVAEGIVVGVLVAPLFRTGSISLRKFDFQFFRVAASFGAPLIIYELASIILDSGDRFLVGRWLGSEMLGQYSVAYNIAGYTYQLVLVPLNLALVPMYMKLWTTKGPEMTIEFLSRGLDLFLLLAGALMCTIIVTAPDVVVVLASRKYEGTGALISIIAGGLLIYATLAFVAAGLLLEKKTLVMMAQVAYAAAANLILNVILLPRMGIKGAAIATLIGYALCIFLLGRRSFRVLPLRLDFGRMGRYLIAGLVAVMAAARLNLGRPFLNVPMKGLVSVTVYFLIVFLGDPRIRTEARDLCQSICGRGAVR